MPRKRDPAPRAPRRSLPARRAAPKRSTPQPFDVQIAAIGDAPQNVTLEFDAGAVTLTHLDKVLWPATDKFPAYTRRDHMRYLLTAAPYMLPHLKDRPLTLIRQPEGVRGRRFVQFHWEGSLPAFIDVVDIYSERNDVAEEYLLCNNVPTLLWLTHVGCLEMHPWHSRAAPGADAKGAGTDYASSLGALEGSTLNCPDFIVLDIDPYIYSGTEAAGAPPEFNRVAFEKGRDVAFWLKDLLDSMKLTSLVKTSGRTGLHVLIPIERALTFAAARAFADTLGRHLMREHPDVITMDQKTGARTGKIFFDANMNARVKTLVAPYSARAVPGAPVAMPLEWSELATATPLDYTIENVPGLLEKRGDLWRDFERRKQDIARALSGA
jgi:bifunctional non-homologous end joining protein LigD